jgi:chemotaxis protein CheY-P-specific phosphatase CheC
MLSENKMPFENHLKSAFQSGYSNAANSLSQLINNKTQCSKADPGMHDLESAFFSEHKSFNSQGNNRIIMTDIFGDVTGKSYLVLSEIDFNLLTSGIPESKDPMVNLKEEFLKELDNILSASVITCLSNELKLKMYGDVPTLLESVSSKVEDIIYDDFIDESEEVYINSTLFSFENHEQAKPLFVWVLDSKIFSTIVTKIAS